MATDKKNAAKISENSSTVKPVKNKSFTGKALRDKSGVYSYSENASPDHTLNDIIEHYQTMYSNPITVFTNSKIGLSAKAALDFIFISGFTHNEFQETFKTTVKTIQSYVVHDLKLDSMLSEKLLKSFALFDKGIEVFGSGQEFHEWLNTSSYGLGNQIPFHLMDTITGINLIEEELIRIEYGDLA